MVMVPAEIVVLVGRWCDAGGIKPGDDGVTMVGRWCDSDSGKQML